MSYSKQVGTAFPGLFLILLDQSGSMRDLYGTLGCSKADVATEAVNQVIYEIQAASTAGVVVRDRCMVGIIAYGGTVRPVMACSISQVEDQIVTTRHYKKGESPYVGQPYSADFEMPIWVETKADGGTPMHEAFSRATELINKWTAIHMDSFPPVVINITDGEPDDMGSAKSAAQKLLATGTHDGTTLLFNAHISGNTNTSETVMPANPTTLPDQYARFLYDLSSPLPDVMMRVATEVGFTVNTGARGSVFNAAPMTLVRVIKFGSGSFTR